MDTGQNTGDNPEVPRLTARRQLHLLILAGVALVLLACAVWGIGRWLQPAQTRPEQLPAGTFRPTPEQLKALTVQTVGASEHNHVTTATGTITADGDLSTPVLLPYSGQVVRVMVDAGERVREGQPLLIVRTPDFVDARNTLFTYKIPVAETAIVQRVAYVNAMTTGKSGPEKNKEAAADIDALWIEVKAAALAAKKLGATSE